MSEQAKTMTTAQKSRFDKCHATLVAFGVTPEQIAEWLRTKGVAFLLTMADLIEMFGTPLTFGKSPTCPTDHQCCCVDALKEINAAQVSCAEHCVDCVSDKCDHCHCCDETIKHLLKAAVLTVNHKHCCE